MAVLIHPPRTYEEVRGVARRYGRRWAHMSVETEEELPELHRVADTIGIRRRHFQDGRRPHYDVLASKVDQAVAAGAEMVDLRQFVRRGFTRPAGRGRIPL